MKRIRGYYFLALFSVFLCMLTGCGLLPTEEEFQAAPVTKNSDDMEYNKVKVKKGDLKKTMEIVGKYRGTTQEEITADGVSMIKKIYVKKGQHVRIGDKVMSYELPGSENTLRQSKNNIEKLRLQIRHANQLKAAEMKRLKHLGGSASEIQNIKTQYDQQIRSYKSSLYLLQLDVKIARREIKDELITAFVTGKVVEVMDNVEGTYGSSEDPIVVIEGKKENRFVATSPYAKYCNDGEMCSVEIRNHEYKAILHRSKKNKKKIWFTLKTPVDFDDGTVCSYQVSLKEDKDVLYLPSAIVYKMGDQHIVYMEDENGLKTMKEVTVGDTVNQYTIITSGLEENDEVISG